MFRVAAYESYHNFCATICTNTNQTVQSLLLLLCTLHWLPYLSKTFPLIQHGHKEMNLSSIIPVLFRYISKWNQLHFCEISSSHVSEYKDYCLLGCCTMKSDTSLLTSQRCLLPPSSGHHCPDDGGSKYLWNISKLPPDYMEQQSKRQSSSSTYCIAELNNNYPRVCKMWVIHNHIQHVQESAHVKVLIIQSRWKFYEVRYLNWGRRKMHTFLSEKLKGRHHLGDLSTDARTILKWVLKKWVVTVWIWFIWHKIGSWALVNTVMNIWVP
jgi:hypothetical protein